MHSKSQKIVINIGEFIENNGKILLLEEYNEKVNEISKLKLILGRLPFNDEEAILLDGTGNHKIGDYIDGVVKVNYEENGINEFSYIFCLIYLIYTFTIFYII